MTGYVRLDCDHRSHDRYLELGSRLMGIGLPTIAYHQPLHECWLARHHEANGTPVVPAGKDSLAYHCVQHEKTRWLARAARHSGATTVIWIDYGIFHLPGVTEEVVLEFYERVDAVQAQHVTIPGIWPAAAPIDDSRPCWVCAGGVLVMPAWRSAQWHADCQAVAEHASPTWEVNTWAKVARMHPEQVRFYPADHDATILTGYHA